RHHATHVAQRGRAVLCDRVVDDPLELLFRERLGHELLENRELGLLLLRLLLATARAERLRRLPPPLALALQHLQLFVVGERALQVLLRRTEAVEEQPERVAPRRVAREHRVLHLALELLDQAHGEIKAPPRRSRRAPEPPRP